MSEKLIESRWSETKDALLEGLQGTKRSTMGVVLENTKNYLSEAASTGATASGNVATLNRVILQLFEELCLLLLLTKSLVFSQWLAQFHKSTHYV